MCYGVMYRCIVDPMSAAAPLINPMLASVVGLLVIAAVVVVVVIAVAKYCIRRRRRSKVTRFGKYSQLATRPFFLLLVLTVVPSYD